jgi:hypothetical protein
VPGQRAAGHCVDIVGCHGTQCAHWALIQHRGRISGRSRIAHSQLAVQLVNRKERQRRKLKK